ncbi:MULTISPECIES: hypothetical protein [unclassified Janthinobacterium]|uniref:hypothetical protein n=1 Tax=unclassified Janthinobacterium TaxID=2610881 RepID=UPI0025B24597|nr:MULTISPECIES: hypothetical protein [unclassified Janthinobacterium]MDN2714884.1 hypothetical protein [Janthinobacterium sp. SUN120]MDO8050540.1 hypothetical protein [Janthinobacterium sp. SUN211]
MLQAQALDNRLVATSADDVLVDRIVPGAPLVIAFGFVSWTTRPAFDFYGRLRKLEQASGQHLNKILVRDSGNAWYHRRIAGLGNHVDETAQALRELVRRIAPGQVSTVGQSMGAYAAVMYGLLLEARQIVAFGPLSFLDVQQARLYHELRWLPVMESLAQDPPPSGYYDLAALCRARATADTQLHLVFGTRPDVARPDVANAGASASESVNLDAMHAQRLAAFGRCTLHPYPQSGHAVVQHLIDTKRINGLLASCILGLTLEEEPMPEIGAAWQDWVAENLRLGCAGEQLVAVLQQHGFSLASSMAAVDAARAKAL